MSPPTRRAARKVSNDEKEIIDPPGQILSPSEIGYFGRPITELKKDELILALTELAKMYKDTKRVKK